MYYPILRGKRHELNAVVELASRPVANRFRPLLEPVNNNIAELASCIGSLYGRGISPYVVINPGLGDYQGGVQMLLLLFTSIICRQENLFLV